MNILITGSSGFIGFHLAKTLLERGETIIGVDIENDYYDVNLKLSRRKILESYPNFSFYKCKIEDLLGLEKIFQKENIQKVCHLAGQAGVRHSIEQSFAYIDSNIVGFYNIIFLAHKYSVENFVYASSSSIYGKNEQQQFSTKDKADKPISLYAATKKANELIAHSYSHIYKLPTTGLRLFTVYGPYSRPDMAMLKFALKMKKNEPIEIYNHGEMFRDFTYIDDVVDGIIQSLESNFVYEIFNLGSDAPVKLSSMVEKLEVFLGMQATKIYLPLQSGELISTWSDIAYTKEKLGWKPKTSIEDGMKKFSKWFLEYYGE